MAPGTGIDVQARGRSEGPSSAEVLAPLLLAPGETLGPKRQAMIITFPRLLYPVAGGQRPQHLIALMTQGTFLERRAGPLTRTSGVEVDAYVARIALMFWRASLCWRSRGCSWSSC